MKNFKKITAIVLSLIMVLGTFAFFSAKNGSKTLAGEESLEQTETPGGATTVVPGKEPGDESTEQTTVPDETPTEVITEEPTTEPEYVPNNYVYSFDSYYDAYPDSNDNGVNLITQNEATLDGVTATASDGDAENVLDYNEKTIWSVEDEETPWITVDLGEVKTIKEIDAWWYDEDTARNYEVMVSTYGNDFSTIATIDTDSFYDDRSDMIVLKETITARYIKFVMSESNNGNNYSLYEIAAYDDCNYQEIVPYLDKINTSENLARNKRPVVARGNNQAMARRYCDGKLNTTWSANKPTDNSWFAVDLGDYYNIRDVMVCWSDANAVDYDVYVSSFEDWYGDYPVASVRDLWANKAVSAISKDINVKARYVKIEVERWSDNSERDGITPAEIVVFGDETEGYYNMQDYKWIWPWEYPEKEGKIFAGWFTDETCTEPYMDDIGYGYAKFIDKKVLTVQFQKKNDDTAVRFVSTLSKDIDDFTEIGFEFSGTYGDKSIKNVSKNCHNIYTGIRADGELLKPKTAFDNEDSAFFFAYTVRNMDGVTGSTWDVTPFYRTADGTKVTGTSNSYELVPGVED